MLSLPRLFRARRCAFTLVEMLIVVVIVGLLAAIVFPLFSRARESARRSVCQSNLRQLGLAVRQYTSDYDGWIAPAQSGTADPNVRAWPTLLSPYVRSPQLFACPDGERPAVAPHARLSATVGTANSYCGLVTGDNSSRGTSAITRPSFSYSWNAITDRDDAWVEPNWGRYGGTNADPIPLAGKRLQKHGFITLRESRPLHEAAVEDFAGTIHIVDGVAGATSSPGNNSACTGNALYRIDTEVKTDHFANRVNTKPASRHFDGFNALYGDGHVKWRSWGTTKAGEWTTQAND